MVTKLLPRYDHLIRKKIDFIDIKGHPSWSFSYLKIIKYSKEILKTLEKSIERLLTLNKQSKLFSMSKDITKIINIYKNVSNDIKNKTKSNKKLIKYKKLKTCFMRNKQK